MAEDFVELGAESINHITDKYFDSGYDRYRKWVNGRKVESVLVPYKRRDDRASTKSETNGNPTTTRSTGTAASVKRGGGDVSSSADSSSPPTTNNATRTVRSSATTRAAPKSAASAGGIAADSAAVPPSSSQISRPRQSTERGVGSGSLAAGAALGGAAGAAAGYYSSSRTSRRDLSIERQQSITSERILREYESERDDPPRRADKILSPSQLNRIPRSTTTATNKNTAVIAAAATARRDSAMGSNYGGDQTRPRSQPPRSRYDDEGDYDSDYDERTGRRSRGTGRGYDDRDYDRVIEETERYRGPVGAGPLVPFTRRESYRSSKDYDDDRTYAMTQYSNRRSGDYDRDRDTYVSRRSSRRGDRDRGYDSRSRSRSREGWKEKLEDTFDTSAKGLGVGIAGAVIGGLAGRELGARGQHSQRDMAIGAIIGGLGANIAAEKWREYKDKKEGQLDRAEDRWEQKWDGNGGIGRSRSNVR